MSISRDKTKDQDLDRLIIQAGTWLPETETLFDVIDVHPGWKCLDMGCGPVGVLPPLSKRVGARGQVIGIDEDTHNINAAKELVERKNLKNVVIIKGNIFKNPLEKHAFDLCHMRFVMNQKGCDQKLLNNMIALTRPGGVVVSQESDWTTWKCYPSQPSWDTLRDAMIALFKNAGGDINAGLRTYQMFSKTNLSTLKIRTAILAMPVGHPYRSDLIQFALTMKKRILEADLLTESEFNENITRCREVINDPSIIIFSYAVTQVWGLVSR
jgi:ubiquinone/menaquinone biosynthesis C-methylase UbiE